MKDTRPLDNDEIRLVSVCFDGIFEARNRGLFVIGASTDGSISELLSLRVAHVYQNGKPVTDLLFDKSIVKGKELSRAVPVNVDIRNAIPELVDWHRDGYGDCTAIGNSGHSLNQDSDTMLGVREILTPVESDQQLAVHDKTRQNPHLHCLKGVCK